MAPGNFRDGELTIPESGNGVPDILDEASWLPRFCRRLRHELIAKKWARAGSGCASRAMRSAPTKAQRGR